MPDGTVVAVNRTFLEWAGRCRDEVVGIPFQRLLAPGDRIFYETHYAPLLRMQGSVREIAVELVLPDGGRLPVLVNSTLRTDPDGRPVGVTTAVFRAVDRREYERELLRARRRAEESELRARVLAETLQRSLIPPAPPAVPGLDVAGAYRPAGAGDEVGGDFYDVFESAPGDWAVVVGDVCGKGAAAATVTALARYTLRAAAIQDPEPRAVLTTLNRALLRQRAERFCTVVYGRLREAGERWCLTVSSGGHPLPLCLGPEHGPDSLGHAGQLLGVVAEPILGLTDTDLAPGDTVVFFTDGITEGRRDRELFGAGRLDDLLDRLRGLSARAVADALVDEVVAFQGGTARDDIAVVVVRVPGR